jgi:hypothetical protein
MGSVAGENITQFVAVLSVTDYYGRPKIYNINMPFWPIAIVGKSATPFRYGFHLTTLVGQ